MMEFSPLPSPGKRAGKLLGLFLPCLYLALSPGCAGDADAGSTPGGHGTGEGNGPTAGRDVRDLVAALTPMAADAPPVELNDWHLRRRRLLERVRGMGPAWGEEALRVYHDRPSTHPEVLSGLLDVAAHTSPEKTAEILVPLITEFDADLHIRTKACSFLATAAPATALQVLEPLLRDPPSGHTYPPRERMLSAWDEAARKSDQDRSTLLCLLATDATNEIDLRHLATRLLGTFESRQGRQALELLMVESGSNTYVRRLATQSLVKTLPEDELCALVRKVIEREADIAFQVFLDNVLQENCR